MEKSGEKPEEKAAEKVSEKTEKLRKIRDEVLALTTSPLYSYRTENKYLPVIGEGSHDAAIMFVGEAPGQNEAKTGRPFCGAAGKILDELLAGAGIKRADVYVTNIVKDRPPANRDPLPSEIESYGPFLDQQIEIIQPKVIATLGRYAMTYIMKKFDLEFDLEPISRAHGKEYQATATFAGIATSITIIALYHPSVALYNRSSLETLKTDFEILKKYKS
jgi:DNA polymerase